MKPTIALFLYDPKCSVQSGNGIIKALQSDYNFKIFGKNELEENFFDDVDIIAVPGGFGDADTFDRAFKHNKLRIKQFVKRGVEERYRDGEDNNQRKLAEHLSRL